MGDVRAAVMTSRRVLMSYIVFAEMHLFQRFLQDSTITELHGFQNL